MKKLIKYLTIPLILTAIVLGGCSKNEKSRELSINNSNYTVSANNILQTKSSFLEDGQINIGVVSDIEGSINNAKTSADKLRKQSVDAVIIAGDCYENEQIRSDPVYPNSTNNLQEMTRGIEPYAKLGVPVFVIAGNHETKSIYKKAIKKLQENYPNVFNINEKSVDIKGLNIVGMGGYHHPRFTTQGGFLLSNSDYNRAEKDLEILQEQKEPNILVTHGPPKSKTSIDYVPRTGHVGDDNIASIMNSNLENIINVHGHIHEGGRNSDDSYNAGISINVASITDYVNPNGPTTSLISIKDGKANYEIVE